MKKQLGLFLFGQPDDRKVIDVWATESSPVKNRWRERVSRVEKLGEKRAKRQTVPDVITWIRSAYVQVTPGERVRPGRDALFAVHRARKWSASPTHTPFFLLPSPSNRARHSFFQCSALLSLYINLFSLSFSIPRSFLFFLSLLLTYTCSMRFSALSDSHFIGNRSYQFYHLLIKITSLSFHLK